MSVKQFVVFRFVILVIVIFGAVVAFGVEKMSELLRRNTEFWDQDKDLSFLFLFLTF